MGKSSFESQAAVTPGQEDFFSLFFYACFSLGPSVSSTIQETFIAFGYVLFF